MPKVLTPKQVIILLRKNGFILKRRKGSHFIFYNPTSQRRVTVPFHPKDLPKGTLHAILKQAGLS